MPNQRCNFCNEEENNTHIVDCIHNKEVTNPLLSLLHHYMPGMKYESYHQSRLGSRRECSRAQPHKDHFPGSLFCMGEEEERAAQPVQRILGRTSGTVECPQAHQVHKSCNHDGRAHPSIFSITYIEMLPVFHFLDAISESIKINE